MTEGSVPAKPRPADGQGEEGQPAPNKRGRPKRKSYRITLTAEEAKRCQICHLLLADHPLKACWRNVG